MKNCVVVFLSLLLVTSPAMAQLNENSATQDRMQRLEHDLMLLQKQIARGEPVTTTYSTSGADIAAGNPAQLEVRLASMEEEMRNLHGKLEENDFAIKRLSESLEKFQRDTEFRFSEAGKAPAVPAAPGPDNGVAVPLSEGSNTPKPLTAGPDQALAPAPDQSGQTTAGDGVLKLPEPGADQNFSTPREHYNYAFRLLNQTKYDEAANTFAAFTKKYPKDPLVGNAYYWMGETFYIRRDYVSAADNFRQGFEALPNGPKAADNLLKLAMSLNALNRDKEACVVLGQITAKFNKTSTSVNDKANQEKKRIGCK